jgi:hypothetical protein
VTGRPQSTQAGNHVSSGEVSSGQSVGALGNHPSVRYPDHAHKQPEKHFQLPKLKHDLEQRLGSGVSLAEHRFRDEICR